MIRYRAILAAFVCFMGSIGAADCNEGHVHLSGPWGSAKFQVEVMDDEAERARGLMNRPQLAKFSAMLFVYERERILSFWMKNTLLPLTAAFVSDDGTIVNLVDMKPQTTDSHCSEKPVRFVLEMNQGWFAKKKIGKGYQLKSAVFSPK